MRRFILALDSGTSSCRALLFNENGSVAAMAQKPLRSVFPQPGWVEQDADDIWAVSYTHLDVYKRQRLYRAASGCALRRSCPDETRRCGKNVAPFSFSETCGELAGGYRDDAAFQPAACRTARFHAYALFAKVAIH